MPANEIEVLKNQLVKQLSPVRIYLFGSFAYGTNTEGSDFDFYIVVDDKVTDLVEMTANAYKAIRSAKQRPVDIIVGTRSRFDERKYRMTIENEVMNKGVLLYESGNETVICKHRIALYFTAEPNAAEDFMQEATEWEEEEARKREHYNDMQKYVKSLKKAELQEQLLNALLELEERGNYW